MSLFVIQLGFILLLEQVYRPPRRVIDSAKTQFRFGETLSTSIRMFQDMWALIMRVKGG